jgi:hypothetical protein
MPKDTSLQPPFKVGSFLLTYILPALVSAIMAATVGFGTSYVGVRDSLLTIRNDVERLKGETEASKSEHEKFVTKEVQAETNRAVLSALGDLQTRIGRIEQTQIQILQRLPAISNVSSLADEGSGTSIPFVTRPAYLSPAQKIVRFMSASAELPPVVLPGDEPRRVGYSNRQERRAVQAAWRRVIRRELFSKFARRVAPAMCTFSTI